MAFDTVSGQPQHRHAANDSVQPRMLQGGVAVTIRFRAPRRASAAIAVAVALLCVLPALPASGRMPVGVVAREVSTSVRGSSVVALPITATHVALHWLGAPDANVTAAYSADGVTFGPAEPVEHDDRGQGKADLGRDRTDHTFGGVIWTDSARFVKVTSDRPIAQLDVVAINARAAGRTIGTASQSVARAVVNQPAVMSRSAWGADESQRFDQSGHELWPPEFYPIQKLTVHHTAGKNNDPDPAATVRAIYYYDAVTKAWGDMGYNFLIDESGRIYDGRFARTYAGTEIPTGEDLSGKGVTGAHVQGYNSGTVGIALLGTLTNQDATPAARAALEQLLAWKADRHSIDPKGTSIYTNPVSGAQKTVANISGHRDWAATECPGGVFYASFPSLRLAVATRINGEPPSATVPGSPTLTASRPTNSKGVRLNWTAPDDGGSPITEYRVLRMNNGVFSRIATLSASTLTYRDTNTKRGRAYTYVVRAANSVGTGPYSNQATATAR